jgi:cytochrome oxidase Cu insertion factor (SCO1/SenC/PrrC family)
MLNSARVSAAIAGFAFIALTVLALHMRDVHAAPAAVQPPQLIDQTGRRFTFTSLRGMPLIVTFVAAHCTDACPLINAQFAQAGQSFESAGVKVRLLTITLDPEHDPPQVMRDLARRFDADPKRWLVASGSVPDVHRVMAAFGVVAQQGRKGYADVHTTFIYFIDKGGNLRKTDLASTALATQIVDEARKEFPQVAQR